MIWWLSAWVLSKQFPMQSDINFSVLLLFITVYSIFLTKTKATYRHFGPRWVCCYQWFFKFTAYPTAHSYRVFPHSSHPATDWNNKLIVFLFSSMVASCHWVRGLGTSSKLPLGVEVVSGAEPLEISISTPLDCKVTPFLNVKMHLISEKIGFLLYYIIPDDYGFCKREVSIHTTY